MTHQALENARAAAAADAAIVNSISQLSDDQVDRRPRTDGTPVHWRFEDLDTVVSITNEAGRIDVNAADDDLVLAFLYSQGMMETTATALLDDLRSFRGTSITEAGERSTPLSRPLESIEELKQIPSWNLPSLSCWLESFTVYTRSRSISLGSASKDTLKALRWAQEHHLGNRDWIPNDGADSSIPTTRSVVGEILRIRAQATTTSHAQSTSLWVGRLTGDQKKPVLTMRWDPNVPIASASCEE